ncbi:MAG: dihydrodipicolinate reductase [Acidobacteria bacterium]|nr:dihydrodipicolinate reductase [Acidobacteriota bacterium]
MHHHMQRITVAQYGVGPIGAEILRLMFEKPWIHVVAAVDNDPSKIGHDVGELIGLGRLTGITVTPELVGHPDVVCHSTGSLLIAVVPQLRGLMEHGCHVISTCEELAFPLDAAIRETLQLVARSRDVVLLGTGVNPGFVMDKLPLTLSAACQTVSSVTVRRVVDASARREPLQRKIGAGLQRSAFTKLAEEGRIRHTGLRESLAMLANGMDLELASTSEETIEPVIAAKRVLTEFLTVEPGDVAGVTQTLSATSSTGVELRLEISMYVGAEDPSDSIEIHGLPDVSATIRGGIHGDRATAAMVVNAIPRILACRPGLLSMDDIAVGYRE